MLAPETTNLVGALIVCNLFGKLALLVAADNNSVLQVDIFIFAESSCRTELVSLQYLQ